MPMFGLMTPVFLLFFFSENFFIFTLLDSYFSQKLSLGLIFLNSSENSSPKVIKLFSRSTQLSVEFFLLINVKMPTIVGILTVLSRKNSIPGLSEPKKG